MSRKSPKRSTTGIALPLVAVVVLGGLLVGCGPPKPKASDATAAAGLARTVTTEGESTVFDYDGDGTLDLLVSNHGQDRWQLYRGAPDGTFAETNVGTFLPTDRHACGTADYDVDGLADFYCTTGACQGVCTRPYPKELWLQREDRTFYNDSGAWGVTDPRGRGREAISFDANADGLPDIFHGTEVGVNYPSPNRLFLNDGGLRMVEAPTFGLDQEIGGQCATAADYDGDGFQDIVVCPTTTGTKVFKNTGGTGFVDASTVAGVQGRTSLDAEFGDLDGDGDPDLVLIQSNGLQVRINEGGSLARVGYSLPLSVGRDVALGDINLDGRPDIYAVQGRNDRYPDHMLLNNGSATGFTAVTIPQAPTGDGDTVAAIPNYKGTGRAAFFVNNGRWGAQGPRQLIEFL